MTATPVLEALKKVSDRQDKIEKFLHESAESQKTKLPVHTISSFVPAGQDPGWPKERLEQLSKNYDPDVVQHLIRTKSKATGRVSAIRRMCELDIPKYLNTWGNPGENYGTEQLEREHGFIPYGKYKHRDNKSNEGAVQKASNMAGSSGILGGYAVPPDFKAEYLTVEEEVSSIIPLCRRIPMMTKTATYPTLDVTTNYGTGKSPYGAGVYLAWQPEAATINQSNAQMRQFTLSNFDMVTYIVISNDLIQDNAIGLDSVLVNLLATEGVFYKEYAFQNGLGAANSMPLGIYNSPATLGVNRATASTITVADITTMFSLIQERSRDKAVWHAHQSTIPKLAQLISNATTGQFAWLNPNGEGVDGPMARSMPTMLFNGRPLHFTQTCQQLGSTGDLRLVDWSQYFVGERMGQQIAVSDQFLFTNNQIVIRSVERVGGSPWLNNYITDAQGFTVSPYVMLQVHS